MRPGLFSHTIVIVLLEATADNARARVGNITYGFRLAEIRELRHRGLALRGMASALNAAATARAEAPNSG